MYQLSFFIELVALFILSKFLTKSLLRLFFKFTNSEEMTVNLIFCLFFPGIVIHELAHLLSAGLFFVKTGGMELVPKITGGEIRLGSVEVAKTDPFRRTIIGVAPVLLGLALIFGILFYINEFAIKNLIILASSFYVIFAVGNTLFSSKKDLEGTVELLFVLFLLLAALFILKAEAARFFVQIIQEKEIVNFFKNADPFLITPILLDLTIVMLVRLLVNKR